MTLLLDEKRLSQVPKLVEYLQKKTIAVSTLELSQQFTDLSFEMINALLEKTKESNPQLVRRSANWWEWIEDAPTTIPVTPVQPGKPGPRPRSKPGPRLTNQIVVLASLAKGNIYIKEIARDLNVTKSRVSSVLHLAAKRGAVVQKDDGSWVLLSQKTFGAPTQKLVWAYLASYPSQCADYARNIEDYLGLRHSQVNGAVNRLLAEGYAEQPIANLGYYKLTSKTPPWQKEAANLFRLKITYLKNNTTPISHSPEPKPTPPTPPTPVVPEPPSEPAIEIVRGPVTEAEIKAAPKIVYSSDSGITKIYKVGGTKLELIAEVGNDVQAEALIALLK